MTTHIIAEVNCTTGESIERPMTTEEIAVLEAQAAEWATYEAERTAIVDAKAAAKASAEAKLAALGLTADEIAAL